MCWIKLAAWLLVFHSKKMYHSKNKLVKCTHNANQIHTQVYTCVIKNYVIITQ